MKKNLLLLILCASAIHVVFAQKSVRFIAEASTDSVLLGHYFEVAFQLENGNSRNFSPPEFDPALEVLSGPNTSSSFSMVNGESSQKVRYSFILRPAREGIFTISPAYAEVEGKKMETQPLEIYVGPNPEGVPQPETGGRTNTFRMDFGDFFGREGIPFPSLPKEAPERKRKTVKI